MPETFSFENIRMEAPETLWCFLEQIIRGAFGNIIRAKGQFAAGDQFLQFDVADHRYSITGTEQKKRRPGCVYRKRYERRCDPAVF